MPFFDKDKVKLELDVNTVLYCGGVLEGTLHMTVMKDIKCRAVYVKISAIEETKRQEHGRRRRIGNYSHTVTHFSQLVVLLDSAQAPAHNVEVNDRLELMLHVGAYSFPFQVRFPYQLPPSFYRTFGSKCISMSYSAFAYVDIPRGSDAQLSVPLLMLSTIPRTLYDRCRTTPYRTAVVRSLLSSGGFGCFSSKDLGYIETSAEIFQTLLALPTSPLPSSNYMPPLPPPFPLQGCAYVASPAPNVVPDASYKLSLRIYISNVSSKADITSVLVKLSQTVEVSVKRRQRCVTNCIACTTVIPPNGHIYPGEDAYVDAVLSVVSPISSSSFAPQSSGSPLPTLSTPFTSTSTYLTITFPSAKVDEPFSLMNVILLSSAVDEYNSVPESFVYRPSI